MRSSLLSLFVLSLFVAASCESNETSESTQITDEVPRPNSAAEKRILQGFPVSINKYPYNAVLVRRKSGDFDVVCGGSLITVRWVLTAASCLFKVDTDSDEIIDRGEHRIILGLDHLVYQESDSVNEIEALVPHELYNKSTKMHNIGLIKLQEALSPSSRIQPVLLHEKVDDEFDPGKEKFYLLLTGFGGDLWESKSVHLSGAQVFTVDNSQCQIAMGSAPLNESFICLTFAQDATTCFGDSGAGVIKRKVNEPDQLVGIQGDFVPCKKVPKYAVRVAPYVPWITKMTWRFGT